MCPHLRINEWAPRSQSQSRFDWFNCCWIFQRCWRQRCAFVRWQYLQIHLSLFRSVSLVGTYPLSRRLLTYFSYRFGSLVRKNYNHKERFNHFSVGYLCACRWSYWSCPSHHFLTFGCHHCVVKSIDWIRYLSRRRSFGFNFKNVRPICYWRRPLSNCQSSLKIIVRL